MSESTAASTPVTSTASIAATGTGAAAEFQDQSAATPWDLVTVPARHGLEAVDILRRSAPSVGPVVHDGPCDTLGFVVPQGTADAWDMPGSACTETAGRGVALPPLDGLGATGGSGTASGGCSAWLLPPGEAGAVTDPAVLRRALGEAARTIEAADGCL